MADERCDSRTDFRDSVLTYRVRCDLPAEHTGRHELRARSTGELVTSWGHVELKDTP